MATLKIVQKLSLDTFKKLTAQLNNGHVNVVAGAPETHQQGISADSIIGKVTRVFLLGKKLEVETSLGDAVGDFRFGQVNDRFFLFKKD